MKRFPQKVAGAAVEDGKLLGEIVKRKEEMRGIKTFLIFPVASFHLNVVPWGVLWVDRFVTGPRISSGVLKQSRNPPFAVRLVQFVSNFVDSYCYWMYTEFSKLV